MGAVQDAGGVATGAAVRSHGTERLVYIDNLRWLMIVLVVAMHSAVTYSGLGSWYYKEPGKLGLGSGLFFLIFQPHLQAFFMGLLFLVAGYFVPSSFDRKGPRRFVWDRAVRLGVPTLIYALVLHPTIGWMLQRGGLVAATATPGRDYARYVFSFAFLEGTGPMWFALALLIFCVVYGGIGIRRGRRSGEGRRAVPSNAAVVGLMAVMAVGSFLVRLVQPIGTSVMNMQLCFFVQYILLFGVGCIARRNDWLARLPGRFAVRWLVAAVMVGPVVWMALILTGGAAKGNTNPYAGGLHWQSAGYCIWESFFCVGMCVGLLGVFRDRFNEPSRVGKFLADNAFAVYVFHAPVLVGLALALRPVHGNPFEKFVLLTVAGVVCTYGLAHLIVRRIPALRRVMV